LTWKLKGTKFSRLLFQLQPKTHRTEEIDVGLLPTVTSETGRKSDFKQGGKSIWTGLKENNMLPTPNAMDWNTGTKPETYEARRKRHAEKGVNLQMTLRQMIMLPTPAVMEDRRIPNQNEKRTKKIQSNLNAYTIMGMLPTPTAMMDEAPIEKVDARNQKQMEKGNSPFILGLGQQAMRGMLPTPNAQDWNTGTKPETYEARRQRHAEKGVNLQMTLRQMIMLPTPTVMDSTNNGDMTAAAKMMQGATHRSSGQPIQKTLTMEIHQQILSDNQPLMQELANKPMLKRTNLPPQKEFVDWIRNVTNAKELSTLIDVKLSTVEHWFRMDAKGFSHPSIEEWIKIAEIFPVTEQMNARMMEQSSIEWTGMLPTPTAMDSTNATATMKSTQVKEGSMHSVTLTRAMSMGILPTPRASDERKHWRTENWKGDDLGSEINHLLGTRSHLNPRFVEEMMGFPPNWTASPFQNGEQNQSKDTAMP
jgi:hypothetical protein